MRWYRGNLHTHSTVGSGDGRSTPEEHRRWYQDHGYDFLAITDHDTLTRNGHLSSEDFVLIENGVEYSGNHLVALGVQSQLDWRLPREAILESAWQEGGMAIAAHPNWNGDHWPSSLLRSTVGLRALEIYNSHGEELDGSPYATDRWDELLSGGVLVWGVASDDAHAAEGPVAGRGWVMAWAPRLRSADLVAALRAGHFTACKGLSFQRLGLSAGRVEVRVPGAEILRLIGPGGALLAETGGGSAEFPLEMRGYARVEAQAGDDRCWSQPLIFEGRLTSFGALIAQGCLG